MFTEKALELIKELDRCPDSLPPFNDELVRYVLQEMKIIFEENCNDAIDVAAGEIDNWSVIGVRHAILARNKRLLLAYIYNRMKRIRTMRWEFGSILPHEVKLNMCGIEIEWFNTYSKALTNYMRSIGDDYKLNLTQNVTPPKSLYIEVRCLIDYGKIELQDGTTVYLKKNTQHLLPRSECEHLVRQGILQHILG